MREWLRKWLGVEDVLSLLDENSGIRIRLTAIEEYIEDKKAKYNPEMVSNVAGTLEPRPSRKK